MTHRDKKTIFITGATSGFGAACARRYAENSNRLILAGRRTAKLEDLQNELSPKSQVHIITLDVRDRDTIFAVIADLPEKFRDIDILINNAGLAQGLEPASSADISDWETMVDTNIKGLIFCTRAILPSMVERKTGHIVNVGSVAGNWPYPGGNVYGGTKAFVKQFSNNLRADLSGTNVRVTNIAPGMAETEFSKVRFKGDEERAAKIYENCKPLTAEDIAEIVHWVTSQPVHVNINQLEVMPTCQSWGPFAIFRDPAE
jgi:NADP-dependent 3-hydroxy acid dehydrogenase YdfG